MRIQATHELNDKLVELSSKYHKFTNMKYVVEYTHTFSRNNHGNTHKVLSFDEFIEVCSIRKDEIPYLIIDFIIRRLSFFGIENTILEDDEINSIMELDRIVKMLTEHSPK